VNDQCQV